MISGNIKSELFHKTMQENFSITDTKTHQIPQ